MTFEPATLKHAKDNTDTVNFEGSTVDIFNFESNDIFNRSGVSMGKGEHILKPDSDSTRIGNQFSSRISFMSVDAKKQQCD